MVGNPALVPGPLPMHLHIENNSTSATKDPEIYGLETTIFSFGKDFLHLLKCEVNKTCVTAGLSWVSTGDILSALLWSAVVSAENLFDPSIYAGSDYQVGQVCHTRFPVNIRSRCKPPLPENYLGGAFAVKLAMAERIDFYKVVSGDDWPALISSLTKVSTAIRRAITSVDRANVKDMISYLAAQQDITKVKLGPKHTGLSIVSWAAQNIYDYASLDFSGASLKAKHGSVIFVNPAVMISLNIAMGPAIITVKNGSGGYWIRASNSTIGWEHFKASGTDENLFPSNDPVM